MNSKRSDLTKPLFVIGRQRSGTTWTANALCNHSQIFGIQNPRYFGIAESWFFSHFDGRFGSLSENNNYSDFLNIFSKTTYFKLSQVKRETLEDLQPENYADLFRQFMETSAQVQAVAQRPSYWLEKSPIHTLYLAEIIAYYPDAKFVGIQRDLVDVVRSSKKWAQIRDEVEKLPISFLPRSVYHWQRCRSFLLHYSEKYPERFFVMSYEALKQDPMKQFKKVLSFLNLDWEEAVLESKYEKNTSFNYFRREDALRQREKLTVQFLGMLTRTFPHALFEFQEKITRPRYDAGFYSLFTELDSAQFTRRPDELTKK